MTFLSRSFIDSISGHRKYSRSLIAEKIASMEIMGRGAGFFAGMQAVFGF